MKVIKYERSIQIMHWYTLITPMKRKKMNKKNQSSNMIMFLVFRSIMVEIISLCVQREREREREKKRKGNFLDSEVSNQLEN